MRRCGRRTFHLLGSMVLAAAPASTAWADSGEDAMRALLDRTPGLAASRHADGRIQRLYGTRFSTGDSPAASADRFRQRDAAVFGVTPEQLKPVRGWGAQRDEAPRGEWGQPVRFLPEEGRFRFTALAYAQHVGDVPVFRGRLVLLVRNDPGFPVVLASADVRDVTGLAIDPAAAPPPSLAILGGLARARYGPGAAALSADTVVWAGVDGEAPEPRVAHAASIAAPSGRWLLVVDAFTGDILYEEDRLKRVDVSGTLQGMATVGPASEQCAEEVEWPIPYAPVTVGGETVYTDAEGAFSVTIRDTGDLTATASLQGAWFDVVNVAGAEDTASAPVAPPNAVELLLNATNQPLSRAEVNAYVAANEVRDFVLDTNPAYPGLDVHGSTIRVNRTDSLCPGNAWYDQDDGSINFCQAGDEHPNTAWSAVVYHEYGHHLVESGGSGQGAYGEGMSDAVSVLLLDAPELGIGFFGDCGEALRDADNDCQYQQNGCSSCGSSSHQCGQLLSGCVWDLRNELLAVDPDGYRETLAALTLDSILVHVGSGIQPSIAIDFLTLDDDNDQLLDGTPHYDQIAAAFGAHGMPVPPIAPIGFDFPDGLPENVDPSGGSSLRVEVSNIAATVVPESITLHVASAETPDRFEAFPLTNVGEALYEAVFPARPCSSLVRFYFTALTTDGDVVRFPSAAPHTTLSAVSATTVEIGWVDDFEDDLGWVITSDPGLGDGEWEIGTPAGGGERGDPPFDADGSGRCALTDNEAGNSDVDDGWTTLTSPSLDVTGDAAFIAYSRWFHNSFGSGPFSDVFVVEVSDDGGLTWVELEVVGPDGPEVSGGWITRQFRIADFVEPTDAFRIRFTTSDDDPPSVVEAAIDDVRVRHFGCEPATCSADVDGDGVVGVDDLVAVITAWGSDSADADVNADGVVDVEDLIVVVLAWGPC